MSAYIVGELMTPDTVGDMGQQNANAVAITGGTIIDAGGTPPAADPDFAIFYCAIEQPAQFKLRSYTATQLNAFSGAAAGIVFYCSDGDGGDPCLAVGDGSSYKRVVLGATVSGT